jgi:tRNA A64-2'-O-ribosylphosphate transferase
LKLDLDQLRKDLGHPIRIAWANQTYFYPTTLQKADCYNLFVLCSASRRVHGAEASEGGYIQGAGDDAEKWSHGLTPPIFWANRDLLVSTDESALPGVIQELISNADAHNNGDTRIGVLVRPSSNLFICQSRPNDLSIQGDYELVIACNDNPELTTAKRLNLGCGSLKLGSRDLRSALDKVKAFAEKSLTANPAQSILVTCETGKDLSVGALLTIICLFYDDKGSKLLFFLLLCLSAKPFI